MSPLAAIIPALALFWFASQSNCPSTPRTRAPICQLPPTWPPPVKTALLVGRAGPIASGVGKAAPISRGASVSTKINAGPTEWRSDRYVGSRRPGWWGGHGKISCEKPATAEQPRRQSKCNALHTRLPFPSQPCRNIAEDIPGCAHLAGTLPKKKRSDRVPRQ